MWRRILPPPPKGPGRPGKKVPPIRPANRPPPIELSILEPVSNRDSAQAEARNVEAYFNRDTDHFEYVRYLSNGATGVSCKVRLKSDGDGQGSLYFVVKRPITQGQGRGMKDEANFLKSFRGDLHFLQLFYFPVDVNNPIEDAPGTTIITEWIENGTLLDLIQRKRDGQLPNRMLLEFFLCLASFCIGMAWPSKGDSGAGPRQERIPDNDDERQQTARIAHNDMHCANVMIGSLDPEGKRHFLVPILKLIDFDLASVEDDAVARNMYDIGMVMRSIIAGDINQIVGGAKLVTIKVGENSPDRTFYTHGWDMTPARYNNLDKEIGSLVQWCMATNERDRPSIENLWAALEELKTKATPSRYADYVNAIHEGDDGIREVVQQLILDP
ncbi:hypothetical protein ANO14919_065950 [Xylariales sp. No.14919]|nr:hypothetical protein ANO14919_065950 [Xylariales sp. No.14919]